MVDSVNLAWSLFLHSIPPNTHILGNKSHLGAPAGLKRMLSMVMTCYEHLYNFVYRSSASWPSASSLGNQHRICQHLSRLIPWLVRSPRLAPVGIFACREMIDFPDHPGHFWHSVSMRHLVCVHVCANVNKLYLAEFCPIISSYQEQSASNQTTKKARHTIRTPKPKERPKSPKGLAYRW